MYLNWLSNLILLFYVSTGNSDLLQVGYMPGHPLLSAPAFPHQHDGFLYNQVKLHASKSFVGRVSLLKDIRSSLDKSGRISKIAVTGMAGAGYVCRPGHPA